MIESRDSKYELAIIDALCNPENWKPSVTKISKQTGIPTSTCFDVIKRSLMKQNRVNVSVVIEIEPKDKYQERVLEIKEKWGEMGCCLKHPEIKMESFWSERTNALKWGCIMCDEEKALKQEDKWKGKDEEWQKKVLLNNGIVI